MQKSSKYQPLVDFLLSCDENNIELSFCQIEKILGFGLSMSSKTYVQWWANDKNATVSQCWMSAGFLSYGVDLEKEIVHFKRVSGDVTNSQNKTINISKAFKKKIIPSPSEEQAEYWLKAWDKLEDYVEQERAIDKLFFGEFKNNDNLLNILIKCSVLNDFYSTNIFKIYPVAQHILGLSIDERLENADASLVNDISNVQISGVDKRFYSFATKYCSHHNPLDFPIYDSYVHKVLKYYRDFDKFYEFDEKDLKDYPKFKNILIEFRKYYGLEKYNLKELDKYLWQFGKHYFPKKY